MCRGGGSTGGIEKTFEPTQITLFGFLGFQVSFVPVPPRETPNREPDSHWLSNQGLAERKKNVPRLVSCDGRPSSPCA